MMNLLATFFLYAMLAAFAQNAVFTRGLGVSRLIRLINDDAIGTFQFWAFLTAIELLAAPMGWFVLTQVLPDIPTNFRSAFRPFLYLVCVLIAYIVVYVVLNFLPLRRKKSLKKMLPLATFNTSVLGTLLICGVQSYTLPQYMGFAFGTSLGYLMAVLLVDSAERRLRNAAVPTFLKGMPITLIYIGVISLAIYGFTGHSLSI